MGCATACPSSDTHRDSTRRLRMTSRVGAEGPIARFTKVSVQGGG
ncbi:hypothetical protein N9E47_04720 [Luminiphilus sp.]|nr:hypothetical protein [Luminiphilus sp.]